MLWEIVGLWISKSKSIREVEGSRSSVRTVDLKTASETVNSIGSRANDGAG